MRTDEMLKVQSLHDELMDEIKRLREINADLLAALKNLVPRFKRCMLAHGNSEDIAESNIQMGLAAIAKAEAPPVGKKVALSRKLPEWIGKTDDDACAAACAAATIRCPTAAFVSADAGAE